MQKSLLLGCGHSRQKRAGIGSIDWTGELVRLDMTEAVNPDVVWNLENRPLPFADEEFDELAAYDVLEHIGRQGDWRGWFDEMAEYHRILKPGGVFGIIVPVGPDALADPGHTRFFSANYFGFLSRTFYEANLAENRPVTDYRSYITRWWQVLAIENDSNHHLAVVLRKE